LDITSDELDNANTEDLVDNQGVALQAKNGWDTSNGYIYYYKNGKKVSGWQTISNETFYFKKTGNSITKGSMLKGWRTINGKIFYFKKSGSNGSQGKMLKGWSNIAGKTFYFKKSGSNGIKGSLFSGFKTISGKRYYFKKSGSNGEKGKMLLGWQKLSGNKYYFKKSGKNGERGSALTGIRTIGSKKYQFSSSGELIEKDVTAQKKSSVTKFLRSYSTFFALPIDSENKYKSVKYDNYYKTNMVLYSEIYCNWNIDNHSKYCNKSINTAKKAFDPQIKKLFGNSANFKVKNYTYSEYDNSYLSYPNLYANYNGKLKYYWGDWGDDIPYGKVNKVYKTGTNTFLVKYSVYVKIYGSKNSKKDFEGTYSIYLKSKGESSYTITNIKLTERAVYRNGSKLYNGSTVEKIKCQI